MNELLEKNRIIDEWLEDNDFYNIKKSSDSSFIRADGYNNRMLIVIKPEEAEIDTKEIMEFASKNKRQVWIANIEMEEENIEWEIL
jgi:hypothetical protein